jgi:diamine N-acetyltransferase
MIYGERIRFRAVEREDLPTFVRWLNDPEIQQGIMIYHPFSLAKEENWFEGMIKRPVEEQVMGIEVREPPDESGMENWRLIGTIGFTDLNWRIRSAEFGIMIGEKNYWGQGYGAEAVRLLTQYGFNTLNLNRIFLRVFEDNPRAIRAYEKAGFTLEGRMRQAEFHHGKYLDVLIMSLLRDDF